MSLHKSIFIVGLLAACNADEITKDAPPPDFGGKGNDALGNTAIDTTKIEALHARAKDLIKPGTRMHVEERLAVPTFLWAKPSASIAGARAPWATQNVRFNGPPAEIAARTAVANFATLYGLTDVDVQHAVVSNIDGRQKGAKIVKLKTLINGIEIFRDGMNVVLDRNLEPVALTGFLTSTQTPPARAGGLDFQLATNAGAAAALKHQAKLDIELAHMIPAGRVDRYENFTLSANAGVELERPIRVKKMYYRLPEGLEAAYYVEVISRTGAKPDLELDDTVRTTEAYGYMVSAVTGQLLNKKTLIEQDFTYRVWGDATSRLPADSPAGNAPHPKVNPIPDGAVAPFVPMTDITLDNFPFSRSATDPWLVTGATETVGNNVDAYLDLYAPNTGNPLTEFGTPTTTTPTDVPNGDHRAQITAAGAFLHTQDPETNISNAGPRSAAIVQLFYMNNFLHDWYYDHGFDEAAGNAQASNYGRGGAEADPIIAQAQDSQGIFNANMLTPADGSSPRMQQFVFPHPGNRLEVTAPAGLGPFATGIARRGPQNFDVTGNIVVATFGGSPCAVTNAAALAGNLALFETATTPAGCTLNAKIAATNATGATAMIINFVSANGDAVPFQSGYSDGITKPIAFISQNAGTAIRTAISAGTTTVRALRLPDRDGTVDNQIVAHEWGHYLSNRLVADGSGLLTNQARAMGEGWSDFGALLLTVRPDDILTPSNATWNGAYAIATHASFGFYPETPNDTFYFGIRRYPYSTDLTINPLTFRHITNGVPLPVGPPVAFGEDGASNAQVHNTGEFWASSLWECYAGMLRDTQGPTPRLTFQQAQDRMKTYLVGSLKATPTFPTILEARDAILSVMLANDVDDYIACRNGFAKRGAGSNAQGPTTGGFPDRFSTTHAGVVEDFGVGPEVRFDSAAFDDEPGCDDDGVVDHGEYGRIKITVRNTGTTVLTGTTMSVSTTSAGMWFPSGTTATFPSIPVGKTAEASVLVALPPGSTGIQAVDFDVTVTNPAIATPLSGVASFRVDTDENAASSATDSVEAATSLWTASANSPTEDTAPWTRVQFGTPLANAWFVPDSENNVTDQLLTSPAFTIDASGVLGVQFDHIHNFEADGGGNYDGGVVEVSINGGAFVDISTSAYTGVIAAGGGNPIEGRQAFTGTSAGFPNFVTTTLTQAIPAGSSVRVRFRMTTDFAFGAQGWLIDNIAFTGVTETPFATVVVDADACNVVPTEADLSITKTDGVTSVTVGTGLTYTITAANAGPGNIIGAQVSDIIPPDLTCTWTCVGAGGGVCINPSGSGNIVDTPTLPMGGSTTYTASCTLSATTANLTLVNTATVANPGPVTDPNPANNSATDTDTIIRLPALLVGSKTVAGTFTQGGTITYTVILGNEGTGRQFDNAGDEFTDVLPAELALVSAAATSGTAVATVGTNTVTWNGEIPAAGAVTITITATINAAAGITVSNQGTFAFDDDGDGTNNATGVTDAFRCP